MSGRVGDDRRWLMPLQGRVKMLSDLPKDLSIVLPSASSKDEGKAKKEPLGPLLKAQDKPDANPRAYPDGTGAPKGICYRNIPDLCKRYSSQWNHDSSLEALRIVLLASSMSVSCCLLPVSVVSSLCVSFHERDSFVAQLLRPSLLILSHLADDYNNKNIRTVQFTPHHPWKRLCGAMRLYSTTTVAIE